MAQSSGPILLEAGTIVGSTPQKLRVALATTDKRIARKYNILLRVKHFLVLDAYDPRIHALYFCPQLYRYDSDNKLVPLEGEEWKPVGPIASGWRHRKKSLGTSHQRNGPMSRSFQNRWTRISTRSWSICTDLLTYRPQNNTNDIRE